ncbi:MAG: DUF2232 domain-containing protein [Deltaproteobacteria bacterium]|jgi:uncharacterized protein YybS (DUF2232 family)|nr:DUF2232 domain-containing protein [Deltaproteobacteria bacterium]
MGLSDKKPAPWRNPLVGRELALGLVATLLFFMSMLMIPLGGAFFGIFTPLPTLLFYYRWGSPLGYWVPGGAAAAGSLLLSYLGMVPTIPFFLGLLGLGFLLGLGMREHWTVEKTIGSSSLFLFSLGAIAAGLISTGIEGGLVLHMEKSLEQTISAVFQQYGAPSPEKSLLEQSLLEFVPTAVRLMPGAAFSSILIVSWLNVLVVMRYCSLHQMPLPPWGKWTLWKAPEILVWGVIAGGFALLLPFEFLRTPAMNVLVVLGTIYLFQGLAVAAFYFERWKLPRVLRAILYGFFLLQMSATLGAIFLGFIDVWIDFRRFARKPSSTP